MLAALPYHYCTTPPVSVTTDNSLESRLSDLEAAFALNTRLVPNYARDVVPSTLSRRLFDALQARSPAATALSGPPPSPSSDGTDV